MHFYGLPMGETLVHNPDLLAAPAVVQRKDEELVKTVDRDAIDTYDPQRCLNKDCRQGRGTRG
jgi:hypothetical protein